MPSADAVPGHRPPTLVALVALVLLEAVVLLGFAVFYAVSLIAGEAATSPGGAAFTLVLLAVFGAWLGSAGIFLWKGRRWPRSVALVAQLFALVIGVPTLTSGVIGFGLAIVVPAVAALFLLFERRVLAFTQPEARQPGPEDPPEMKA